MSDSGDALSERRRAVNCGRSSIQSRKSAVSRMSAAASSSAGISSTVLIRSLSSALGKRRPVSRSATYAGVTPICSPSWRRDHLRASRRPFMSSASSDIIPLLTPYAYFVKHAVVGLRNGMYLNRKSDREVGGGELQQPSQRRLLR